MLESMQYFAVCTLTVPIPSHDKGGTLEGASGDFTLLYARPVFLKPLDVFRRCWQSSYKWLVCQSVVPVIVLAIILRTIFHWTKRSSLLRRTFILKRCDFIIFYDLQFIGIICLWNQLKGIGLNSTHLRNRPTCTCTIGNEFLCSILNWSLEL